MNDKVVESPGSTALSLDATSVVRYGLKEIIRGVMVMTSEKLGVVELKYTSPESV